jgi:hypothetical protein
MYRENREFEKPENENAKIWRYIDFAKLVSLLDKQALFFSRADKLGDPFEGAFTKENILQIKNLEDEKSARERLRLYEALFETFPKCTVLNCWHLNEFESAAMWRLYLSNNQGVALQSTFSSLKNSIDEDSHVVYIGKVKYIDYDLETIPEGLYSPFVHKRKNYEHEREIRALVQEPLIYNKNGGTKPPFDYGLYVKANLNELIQKIYVAPASSPWFYDLVKDLLVRYNLKKEVFQSSLDEKPIYYSE